MDRKNAQEEPTTGVTETAAGGRMVSERLLRDVDTYIRHNMDAQGYVRVPTRRMCADLGCSHASIRRALGALEADAKISVDRSHQPAVIRYTNADACSDPVVAPLLAVKNVSDALLALRREVEQLAEENWKLRQLASEWISLRDCIVSKAYLTSTRHLFLSFRNQDRPSWYEELEVKEYK